jgi:hypothetical protein
MSGKRWLFPIDQPAISIAKRRNRPPQGDKPDPRDPPDWVVTEAPIVPASRVFASIAEAKVFVAANPLPSGTRQFVIHIAHGARVDPEHLLFLEPLATSGIEVFVGLKPIRGG